MGLPSPRNRNTRVRNTKSGLQQAEEALEVSSFFFFSIVRLIGFGGERAFPESVTCLRAAMIDDGRFAFTRSLASRMCNTFRVMRGRKAKIHRDERSKKKRWYKQIKIEK